MGFLDKLDSGMTSLGGKLTSGLFGSTSSHGTQTEGQKKGMSAAFRGLNAYTGANAPMTNVDKSVTQRYYQSNVIDPAMRQYQNEINPNVKAQFSGNYWSTGRQKAQQSAMQGLMNNANAQYQELANKDRMAQAQYLDDANNRALQAAEIRGQLAAAPTKETVANGGVLGKAVGLAGSVAGIASMF